MLLEGIRVVNHSDNYGPWRVILNQSSNTLVLRQILTGSGYAYRNADGAGDLFLDDVACAPFGSGNGPVFVFKNQSVWARQLNPEAGEPQILNDGGKLWVLGLKVEKGATCLETRADGWSEVLGGYVLAVDYKGPDVPVILNDESHVSATLAGGRANAGDEVYTTVLKDRRNGVWATSLVDSLPKRTATWDSSTTFALPMYVGYATALREMEKLKVSASTAPHFSLLDSRYSHGTAMHLNATSPGNSVSYEVPIAKAGRYNIRIGVKKHPTRGIFQMALLSGSSYLNKGTPQDTYASVERWEELDLGDVDFATAGDRILRFTVTGKNPAATGHLITMDYLKLSLR